MEKLKKPFLHPEISGAFRNTTGVTRYPFNFFAFAKSV
jgi:hypothetical protein